MLKGECFDTGWRPAGRIKLLRLLSVHFLCAVRLFQCRLFLHPPQILTQRAIMPVSHHAHLERFRSPPPELARSTRGALSPGKSSMSARWPSFRGQPGGTSCTRPTAGNGHVIKENTGTRSEIVNNDWNIELREETPDRTVALLL